MPKANNEAKMCRSTKPVVLRKAKLMSNEDLEEARAMSDDERSGLQKMKAKRREKEKLVGVARVLRQNQRPKWRG